MKKAIVLITIGVTILIISCKKEVEPAISTCTTTYEQSAVLSTFGGEIDLNNLKNYANQTIPNYINKDNTGANSITDAGATLGRVLFYDKNLSIDNTISCSSCHKQSYAFGDTAQASIGVNGTTGRHSMRLVNSRFSIEQKFFWDERATTLEEQTTKPIQDHVEMGYSGQSGNPNINVLLTKLEGIEYYNELFTRAYGSMQVTESKMQNALAQFIRSIQSFDSKFDVGRATALNDGIPFSNFTAEENQGKQLFLAPPQFNGVGVRTGGGLGCNGCHNAPEFDIDPNTRNNGVIGTVTGTGTDFTVTRAPSLRDVIKANGTSNGPFMHIGVSNNFRTVLTHYDKINITGNPTIDNRLRPGGNPQDLAMTNSEKNAVIAFIKTISGNDIYTNDKWADPF